MTTGQSEGDNSSTEVPSSQVTPICFEPAETNHHIPHVS